MLDQTQQAGHYLESLHACLGRAVRSNLKRTAHLEVLHDLIDVGTPGPALEDLTGRSTDQLTCDAVGTV